MGNALFGFIAVFNSETFGEFLAVLLLIFAIASVIFTVGWCCIKLFEKEETDA